MIDIQELKHKKNNIIHSYQQWNYTKSYANSIL